jgi:hypothetical protein
MLVLLRGVNDSAAKPGIGSFGALDATDAAAGVRFAGVHADVPFTMSAMRAIHIAPGDVNFDLKFSPPASDVLLPVGSIELAGTLAIGCGALAVSKAKLVVPTSVGTVAFHGSTVASLMGAPTETLRGQAAAGWALELAGSAKQVYAPGVLDDGGIEP